MKRRKLLGTAGIVPVWLALSCSASPFSGGSTDDSVGDVSVGGGPSGGAQPGLVRARIRNESSHEADVTLRFVRNERVVHDSFVRVPPDTITTVASLQEPDVVELSGVNDAGQRLVDGVFFYGVDFTESRPAEYWIRDPQGGEPGPVFPIPAFTTLQLLAPADDVAVSLGEALDVAWADEHADPGAAITLYLRPVASASGTDLLAIAERVPAALDGLSDRLHPLIQGVAPGRYDVLARLEDGGRIVWAVAGGVVTVRDDPRNTPPTITILSPSEKVTLRAGDELRVVWMDRDPDDNAAIVLHLEPSVSLGTPAAYVLGGPFLEDPDGPVSDSAALRVHALPGVYDLSASISDGRLAGVHRLPEHVVVAAPPANDPPQLELREPAADLELERGASVQVRWDDSDENDDARISFVLDPDLANVPLDGDEILLAAGVSEDDDAAGDELRLDLSPDIPVGVYRMLGVIHDGLTEVAARAPGLLYIGRRAVEPGDGDGDQGGGGGGPGGGDPGDGGGDTDPPEDRDDVIVLEPIGDIRLTGGHPVTVRLSLDQAVPLQARPRVFLSNLDRGGTTRVEVQGGTRPRAEELAVSIPPEIIPNASWPRVFDLDIETTHAGRITSVRSQRPVWIRQEVSADWAQRSPRPCQATAMLDFDGVQVGWYGGGYDDREPPRQVQFWLSSDGAVPEGGRDDSHHSLVYTSAASPNRVQVLLLTQNPASIRADGPVAVTVQINPSLEPGLYRLVAVLDPTGPDRTVTDLLDDPILICVAE